MEYTAVTLNDNTYEVQDEARLGGLEDILGIVLPEDVQTWPTFGAVVGGNINANEAGVTATGAFTMKTGKKATKVLCIVEKNSRETKSLSRGAFETDVKVTVQNTVENQGLLEKLRKVRFCAYIKEAQGDGFLVGKPGVTTAYLAQIKSGSYSEKSGEKFEDESMIEFVITAKPFRPYAYSETFSFAAGV